jgi:hypothetical protein
MTVRNHSEVVSFDADAALADAQDAVEGTLFAFVEYDADEFNPLYVDDATLTFYDDEQHMLAHFDEIHSYVHVDFMEMGIFVDDLFPVADHVRYITTGMDYMTLVRVYADREGVFVALAADESVQPLVAAVERHVSAVGE